MFKRADVLNGIDAWRHGVRFLDHGRSIRLETLRTEVRVLHTKPIKNLEAVTVGMAEFENKIREYVEAGGKKFDDSDMKSDLLAILPQELREISDGEPLIPRPTRSSATWSRRRRPRCS